MKRKAFRNEPYWGRPVPGFGDPNARLLIIGLAPAAHGANRTGRMFTGDSSGNFLYAALHRAGWINQPTSIHRDDGLRLMDAYITAIVRCAPPGNRPLPVEISQCRDYLMEELTSLRSIQVVWALGRMAFDGFKATLIETGRLKRRGGMAFSHGATYRLNERLTLVASYHPSQHNTQTGRLTQEMFDVVIKGIQAIIERAPARKGSSPP